MNQFKVTLEMHFSIEGNEFKLDPEYIRGWIDHALEDKAESLACDIVEMGTQAGLFIDQEHSEYGTEFYGPAIEKKAEEEANADKNKH